MPKGWEHAKNILRLRKSEELYYGGPDTKLHKIICFSASFRQYNIAYGVVHV